VVDVWVEFNARSVRVIPVAWNGHMSCRVDVWTVMTNVAPLHPSGSGSTGRLSLLPNDQTQFISGVVGLGKYPERPIVPNSNATQRVQFEVPLSFEYQVITSVLMIDSEQTRNLRYNVEAANLSRNGFDIVMSTWQDTVIYSARVHYIVVPKNFGSYFNVGSQEGNIVEPMKPLRKTELLNGDHDRAWSGSGSRGTNYTFNGAKGSATLVWTAASHGGSDTNGEIKVGGRTVYTWKPSDFAQQSVGSNFNIDNGPFPSNFTAKRIPVPDDLVADPLRVSIEYRSGSHGVITFDMNVEITYELGKH